MSTEKFLETRPLTSELQSALITTLSGHQWSGACLLGTKNCWSPIGSNELSSAQKSESTPFSRTSPIPSHFYKSLRIESAQANAQAADNRSENAQSNITFEPWARRSPCWGPTTQGTTALEIPISGYSASFARTRERTLQRLASNPSLS